jgi:DNA replication protein DnaC
MSDDSNTVRERREAMQTTADEVNTHMLGTIPPMFAAADATHPTVQAWADAHAELIAQSWPASRGTTLAASLLIAGPVGTGKTHNSFGAIRRIASHHVPVVFRYVKHADMIAASRYKSGFSPREEFEKLTRVPLLIIDDLGTSDDPDGLTARIVDTRYDNLDATIFTSNFNTAQISKLLGERVASRLADCKVVNLTGADRRRPR